MIRNRMLRIAQSRECMHRRANKNALRIDARIVRKSPGDNEPMELRDLLEAEDDVEREVLAISETDVMGMARSLGMERAGRWLLRRAAGETNEQIGLEYGYTKQYVSYQTRRVAEAIRSALQREGTL